MVVLLREFGEQAVDSLVLRRQFGFTVPEFADQLHIALLEFLDALPPDRLGLEKHLFEFRAVAPGLHEVARQLLGDEFLLGRCFLCFAEFETDQPDFLGVAFPAVLYTIWGIMEIIQIPIAR